ncbi:MAG: GrpB family protein [Chloroflexota bacterium]|nr:GrpB family protein [Chloroflexota bacterium]
MLGLQRGSVQLVTYTSAWARLFESERARLYHTLGSDALDIQHIGSTAVPGLAAKPLLDLGIAVAGEAVVRACIPRITALGYTYRGYRGADQGYFFDLGHEQQLTHYLHMLLIDDPGWWNYLRFRDHLCAHPAARAAYQQLKQDLATQYATDRAAYSAAKTTFVQQILAVDTRAAEG